MGYSSISIPLLLTLVICFSVDADDSYLDQKCFGSLAKYSNDSLNGLVQDLQTNATDKTFWNASWGEGSTTPVYGLASCRGDLNQSDRMQCLARVASRIVSIDRECVNDGQFFLYDYCSIKVSSSNFFGTLDFDIDDRGTGVYSRKGASYTIKNITDSITTFMKGTADAAAANLTSYYHDGQVYNPTENATIFGMSQCSKDLPIDTDSCKVCLDQAISTLDKSKIGGTVVSGSCQVRYETYKFLNN